MLELKNITKVYKTGDFIQKALDNVSIKFRKNEFVSILGPSGSGKTTLLNLIGGLDSYTSGDLIINGQSSKKYKDKDWDTYRNHKIGFVFQSYNLISHQSVLRNVELALTLSGVSKSERVRRAKDALKKVGLERHINKKPNQLSGGQMQRVAIARALINNPDILLADEPSGALDSKTSIQIMDLLKEISKEKLVIMVTHNPELANTYSTRIIELKDGKITSDSMSYDEKEEKTEEENKFKTHLSFKTALSLSLNNLMTKKGRTILTSVAGSIGIIGIALILSLSNGINSYIDRVQEETLASYPISLTDETMDTSSMIMSLMNTNKNNKDKKLNKIYTNTILTEMINNLNSSKEKNNLNKFKKYLDKNKEEFDKYASVVSYNYNITPMIYRIDDKDEIVQVNPSTVVNEMGFSEMMDMASSMSLGKSDSNNNVFEEIIDNDELNKNSYDVIAGTWPDKYNEVILFVNSQNEISDYTLYSLGLLDQSEIKDNMNKIKNGEQIESKNEEYTYEEILNLEFKLVLNTKFYKENKIAGIWEDKSKDEKYVSNLVNEGETLKVVGIARPSEESVNQDSSGTIGYLPELINYIITENDNSLIAKKQKENKDINVFTNDKFESDNSFDITKLSPQEQAYIRTLSPEELTSLIEMYKENENATYNDNLEKLGAVDIEYPNTINIYPKDFESKEIIQNKISEYNESAKEEDKINYTDIVGIMMKGVTSIVNTISYVLIAFVSISLIVSSIMIGIITYISVLERTKEIGILRAIGASKKDISRVFNAETFLVGLTSGLIGILVTILLNIPINMIIKEITDISKVASLPLFGGLVLVLISMLLTVIAGLIPSRMAAKKDPVIALRTE